MLFTRFILKIIDERIKHPTYRTRYSQKHGFATPHSGKDIVLLTNGDNDKIEPAFMFGSFPISSKMWFYKLKTPGQWLDDDHINIALYYFRKLARHSDNVHIRATTTNCLFHAKITALYDEYTLKHADKSLLSGEGDVAKYIRGFSMDVNTPWVNVDYVLFPIHMSSPEHWFLLTFDVHRRLLKVYNSLQPNMSQMRTKIMDILIVGCSRFVLLSMLFTNSLLKCLYHSPLRST